jgi:D-alanyl-lipoteichoic acid acyltransferase DltB (MBOAT superfamily)
MGGSRHGLTRQMLVLFITMFLAGLWHGAGWTYAVFGILHGLALCTNHLWRKSGFRLPAPIAWLTFMTFFITSLSIFRSADIATAMIMVKSMYGLEGVSLSATGGYNEGLLIAGILISMFGPTSQDVVYEKLRPHPLLAMVFSMAAIYTVMTIGNHGYSEFIYFQF